MIHLKCLTVEQMDFILANHEKKNAQQISEALRVEKYKVKLFCQANDIVCFGQKQPKEPKRVAASGIIKINRLPSIFNNRPSRYY